MNSFISRAVVRACAAVALSVFFLLTFCVTPRSRSVINQIEVVRLLESARAEWSSTGIHQVQRIVFLDRTSLLPETEQVVGGYKVRVHVRSSRFTIEATPLIVGKTGLFSFFRDELGVVRYEPALGQPAGADSRRWSQALEEGR